MCFFFSLLFFNFLWCLLLTSLSLFHPSYILHNSVHLVSIFSFPLLPILLSPIFISHPSSSPTTSIIAARRKSPSRRRRSRTSPSHPAFHPSTPITTLWRRQPPPPPSQMAQTFFPPLRWPGNWHVHRPSVHPVRTMSCLSTSSPLSRSSTINQMGWGTEVTGSATAASSSRTWNCQCLWTFQTTVNQTWPARSPWGTCSHAAAASAPMFSWPRLDHFCLNELGWPRQDWAWVRLCFCQSWPV